MQVDMLTTAFSSFGVVQNVKLVRDKGGIGATCVLAPVCITGCIPARVGALTVHCQTCKLFAAVAYIKFEKASCAARAIELMHEAVLNEGRGPLLKVFLAEAPSSR